MLTDLTPQRAECVRHHTKRSSHHGVHNTRCGSRPGRFGHCRALPNQTYASNNGKVSFKMFHALTRVDINVTNVDKATGMTITVFTMGSLLDGKRPLPYDNEEWNLLTGGSGILTKVTCIPTRLPYSPATDGTKTNLATFFVMPIRKGLAYKPSFKIA